MYFQKYKTHIIVSAVIVLGLCAVLYLEWGPGGGNTLQPTSEETVALGGLATGQPAGTRSVPGDAREYRSEHYGFSILYPDYLTVTENPGPDDTETLVFQNTGENPTGFQIFILPYSKPTIDNERFRKDVPSGVQKDVRSVTLAGAEGASFYSQQLSLGETYEVWIIHDGRLFEITTLAPLDEWLESILSTWQFIK